MPKEIDTSPVIKRINALVKQHGTLRNVAFELKLEPAWLSRVRAGKISPVSPQALKKLGFRIVYKKEF